jgi:hypothetical protein
VKHYCTWIAGILLLTMATPVMAGSVSVRLVEASNTQGASSAALGDVVGILKNNLRYSRFTLLAAGSMRLPQGGTRALAGYVVTCKGSEKSLRITVKRGRGALINTTVQLARGRPLILGGFPSGGGKKIVFVFTAN